MSIILQIKGKLLHLILFILLAVYVLSANTIYTTFFLKNGKPIPGEFQPPPESHDIQFLLVPIEQVRYDGQDFYALRGYALHDKLKPADYRIRIVLHSIEEDLLFDVDGTPTFDLLVKRPDYQKYMNEGEFRFLFSKNVLKVDNYQVGILLEEKQGSGKYYQLTGFFIERTPNDIRYIAGP